MNVVLQSQTISTMIATLSLHLCVRKVKIYEDGAAISKKCLHIFFLE